MKFLAKAHDRVTEFGLQAGMLALAAIAVLSFVATMSRYFLNTPIGWVPDWVGYLLATSVFIVAPAVTLRAMHVSMDVLSAYLRPGMLSRALAVISSLLTLLILATTSWIVWQSVASAWRSGMTTSAGYPIPTWWLFSFIFYGFASSGLHVLRSTVKLFGPSAVPAARPAEAQGE